MTQALSELAEQPTAENPAEEYVHQSTIPPERLAWRVLLTAFAVFCLLGASALYGIYFFLFESMIAIPTALQVTQGTVGITGADLIETVERGQEILTSAVTGISTDSQSQATIQFWDDQVAEDESPGLIAAVTLQRNTYLTFNRAARPRFEWSSNQQHIRLSQLSGQLDVIVSGAQQPFLMSIHTEGQLNIEIAAKGRYRIQASDDEVRLLNLVGAAALFFADDDASRRLVPSGQEGLARLGSRVIDIRPATENVLTNAVFSLQDIAEDRGALPNLPPKWGCHASHGAFAMQSFNGRAGIRLRRLGNVTSSGEVRCIQPFGSRGLDVTDFDSVRVVTTFNLNYQSLSRCGIQGSECPLMLLITYEDRVGVTRRWFRGFYYDEPLDSEYPTRCASCFQDHLIINPRTWYTFESENLFSLINEERHPARLRSIEFYTSGHQFDTLIGEMMILVDSSDAEGSDA